MSRATLVITQITQAIESRNEHGNWPLYVSSDRGRVDLSNRLTSPTEERKLGHG